MQAYDILFLSTKNMKNKGIGVIEIIVLLGLMALIVWGLNYMITKDYVIVRTPVATVSNNVIDTSPAPVIVPDTLPTSTPTTTPKTPAPTKPAPTAPTPPTTSALTVTFTSKGFSPASLTVKKGQTVKFINNSAGNMWVAANPFPSSSEYPAFNEKAGVASGSSWSFTFDKVGTWYYHNHYVPAQGARIIVSQ